ncbi:3933_t:CDS:2, partial [Acaulospora colombiana]
SVLQVFEASVEIFWLVLSGMRSKLKREIEVLFNEIFIPILEMRTSTAQQKLVLLNMVQRLCQDPQALVEIYLNYDCDLNAAENIYERLINIISKQSSAQYGPAASKSSSAGGSSQVNSPTQPISGKGNQNSHTLPPSLTTSALSEATTGGDTALIEAKLHRQSLESLVHVLKSLVAWKDAANRTIPNTNRAQTPVNNQTHNSTSGLSTSDHTAPRSSLGGDDKVESAVSSGGHTPVRTSSISNRGSVDLRLGTPVSEKASLFEDDPNRFESERIRKMTMAEGVKLFNNKPKR